jgi:hypothetical protein
MLLCSSMHTWAEREHGRREKLIGFGSVCVCMYMYMYMCILLKMSRADTYMHVHTCIQ